MQARINGLVFQYPASPDELTIGQWIEFVRAYGMALDENAARLALMEPGKHRLLATMELYAERAYCTVAFFAGIPLSQAKATLPLPAVTALYRACLPACFNAELTGQVLISGNTYELPAPELSQGSTMTFGEVLDSKAMQQNAHKLEWTRWELIHALCCIFLRQPGEPYNESMTFADGQRALLMYNAPIRAALEVGPWYEQLCEFLEASFTVFQDSNEEPKPHMKAHFKAWGWVNFLKSIAKAKVFDVPGSELNSIDCARRSRAFDVLMYASEEKEYSEALNADYQAKKQG